MARSSDTPRPASVWGEENTSTSGLDPEGEAATDRPYLVVFFARDSTTVFRLPEKGEVTLGRGEIADLHLPDNAVSRKHAKIEAAGSKARIVDHGSQNGPVVNGQPLKEPRTLVSGDVIELGSNTLVSHASPRPAPSRRILEF